MQSFEINQTEQDKEHFNISILYERISELEEQLEYSEQMCKKWKDLVIVFHDEIHRMVNEQGYKLNSSFNSYL